MPRTKVAVPVWTAELSLSGTSLRNYPACHNETDTRKAPAYGRVDLSWGLHVVALASGQPARSDPSLRLDEALTC